MAAKSLFRSLYQRLITQPKEIGSYSGNSKARGKLNQFRNDSRRSRTSRLRFESLEVRQLLVGDLDFADRVGGTGVEQAFAVATDSSGDSYTVGTFQGTADFDPGPNTFDLVSKGASDIYILKTNHLGEFAWVKQIGGTQSEAALDVVLSGASIAVTGYFSGTVDFHPGLTTLNLTSAGQRDAFLLNLNYNGTFNWAKRMGGAGNDEGKSVKSYPNGDIYMAGPFSGTADFNPSSAVANLVSAGNSDAFIAKYTSTGAYTWAKRMGGSDADMSTALTLVGNDIVTVGTFSATADFNPGSGTANLTSAGGRDVFVSRLDTNGAYVWAKRIGGTGFDTANDVQLAGTGVIIAGEFEGTVDFNPSSAVSNRISAGQADAFVASLDGNGNFLGASRFGGTGQDIGYGVLGTSITSFTLTGSFSNTVDFDLGSGVANQTSNGAADIFVLKYDNPGGLLWVHTFGSVGDDRGYGISTSPDGVRVVGHFRGTVDFDSGLPSLPLTSSGSSDAFLLALSHDLIVRGAGPFANITVRRNGSDIEVFNNTANVVIDRHPLFAVRNIVARGTDAVIDRLAIDFAFGGNFLPTGFADRVISSNQFEQVDFLGSGTEKTYYEGPYFVPNLGFSPEASLIIDNGVLSSLYINTAGAQVVKIANLDELTVGGGFLVDDSDPETPIIFAEDVMQFEPTLGADGRPAARLTGNTPANLFVPLTFQRVTNLVVNTDDGDDRVNFINGSLDTEGLTNVTVNTGLGDDILAIARDRVSLPGDGSFSFISGDGNDRLVVEGDAGWELSTNKLASSMGGALSIDTLTEVWLSGGPSDNLLDATTYPGKVTMDGRSGNDTLLGTSFDDLLVGGDGEDNLYGNGGNDVLFGLAGKDSLFGGFGNDELFGGDGNDFLHSGVGFDVVRGEGGADEIYSQGTKLADTLRLIRNSDASATFVLERDGVIKGQDSITYDDLDWFTIDAFDGDDRIEIDPLFANTGIVDGGQGNDSCTAPINWTKISC